MIRLVLLAFNEEAAIAGLIEALEGQLKEPHEFIVVDDGSTDRTAARAKALAGRYPVKVLSHGTNRGVAAAFDTGLRHAASASAENDLIFTMEGDKTNDPANVPAMIAALREGADLVCASRYRPGGGYVGFPFKRYLFSLGANYTARLFFGVPGVTDYTFFYRGYRAGAIQAAIAKFGPRFIECTGFASNAEILTKVAMAGAIRCTEVPSVYRYDLKPGESKMRVWSNLREYLRLYALKRG